MTPHNFDSYCRTSARKRPARTDRRTFLAGATAICRHAGGGATHGPRARRRGAGRRDDQRKNPRHRRRRRQRLQGRALRRADRRAHRFMPPRKPVPWAGVRSAEAWAGHAPQLPPELKQRPEFAGLGGVRDTVPESEDCLTLNVLTRGLGDGAKRPVMVWYHGGGLAYGSANTHAARRHQSRRRARRRGRHRQPPPQHPRLSASRRAGRAGVRAVRQCRRARHAGVARMGARQHRALRRRSRQRDDLRPIGRRRQGHRPCWRCRRHAACSTARS